MSAIASVLVIFSAFITRVEQRLSAAFRQGPAVRPPNRSNGFAESVKNYFSEHGPACFGGRAEFRSTVVIASERPTSQALAAAEQLVNDAPIREESLPEPFGEQAELVPPQPTEPEADPTEAPEFQDWGAPIARTAARVSVGVQREPDSSETSDSEDRQMTEALRKKVEESVASLAAARANESEPPTPVVRETPQAVSIETPQADATLQSRNARPRAAKLKRRQRELDLQRRPRIQHKPNRMKNALVEGAPPPPDVLADAMQQKKATKRERLVKRDAMVFRERPGQLNKSPKPATAPAEPTAAPVEVRPNKSELRKQKAANGTVDAWDSKPPKQLSKFVGRIGSVQDTYFSVLKDAHSAGHSELHHTAIKLIQHFRETAGNKPWEHKARSVLSAEITALKSSEKNPRHDLKRLAHHFGTYSRTGDPNELAIASEDLEDLKTLGDMIAHLLEDADRSPTSEELKDTALFALRRDLELRNPHNYLQGNHEGARLARLAMQQGLQAQTERAVAALNQIVTEREHAQDVQTIGNCSFSNMTQEQSAAACRLTTAFLNRVYDLEKDDAAPLPFDSDALAYLEGAALLILSRRGNENEKLDEVREFYADALVVLPLEDAVDAFGSNAPTAGVAKIVTGLAAWLFRESEKPAQVSLEAGRDLQFFVNDHRTQAWSVLHRMRPD
jgi:hypothetical protein